MNNNFAENVILVDGDYIDKVAFDLIVNFERMLERRIPHADLAHWLDCVALDGGLRPQTAAAADKETEVSVIFLHSKPQLQNFLPAHYEQELNGKAFKDDIAEFSMTAYKKEDIVSMEDLFTQTIDVLKKEKNIKRLMVIPDAERYLNGVKRSLAAPADSDDTPTVVTVFAMEPVAGPFRAEILGYSLMSALGIKSAELNRLEN